MPGFVVQGHICLFKHLSFFVKIYNKILNTFKYFFYVYVDFTSFVVHVLKMTSQYF